MARSIDRRAVWVVPVVAFVLVACSGGPSKSAALEIIQRDLKEDGTCTLGLDVMRQLKMQYASKGVCIPNEGAKAAEVCFQALAAAGVTHVKSPKYMVEYEDSAAANDVYNRHARNIIFSACYDMEGLREGGFPCAEAHADKVLKITATGDKADVLYQRDLAFRPSLAAIEKACGPVTRPAPETVAPFVKGPNGWALAAPPPDPNK